MTGHMSAFTNFILSFFRIHLSFQIVSSFMVAFLALLALMSSEQLPVFVLMAPRYLNEFTLSIVSPSTSIDTFAFSSHTRPTISLVFRAFNFSSLMLPPSIIYFVYYVAYFLWRFTAQCCRLRTVNLRLIDLQ